MESNYTSYWNYSPFNYQKLYSTISGISASTAYTLWNKDNSQIFLEITPPHFWASNCLVLFPKWKWYFRNSTVLSFLFPIFYRTLCMYSFMLFFCFWSWYQLPVQWSVHLPFFLSPVLLVYSCASLKYFKNPINAVVHMTVHYWFWLIHWSRCAY